MKVLLFVAVSALLAPYQCASGETAERPIEDTAPKALWNLAQRFREQGDTNACETVYSQLTEQYPSSRYAKQARETTCTGGARQRDTEAPSEQSSGDANDIEAGGSGESSDKDESGGKEE